MMTRRPDSLGPAGRRWVFASLCLLSFAFAGVFAIMGAWPVLPYSALEMLLVYCAFRWIDRAQDWERLTLSGAALVVERSERGRVTTWRFNRHWVQVRVATDDGEASELAPGVARLTLSESGRCACFGAFLPAAEVRRLARDVKVLLAAR